MAFNYSPKIVTNGLVLALDAANKKSYPGSGTTWSDLSGNGYTATLLNGTAFSSINFGTFVFDGTNDNASIPYNTNLDPTSGITFEAWIYPTNITTNRYYEIYRKNVATGRHLFSFQEYGTIL